MKANRRWLLVLVVALLLAVGGVVAVAATRGDDDKTTVGTPSGSPSPAPSGPRADDPAYDDALSTPREDSVYPNVGDPGVDSLHYDLDLAWDPEQQVLDGTATLIFRATETAAEFRLDLGEPLEVTEASVDGTVVETEHNGKDLVVKSEVEADERYVLVVRYTGTPEPVEAPTTRSDFTTTGWTITDSGAVWTMQEPYGAFTWYPVNDQPADKAFYDFTISVPAPWVGIANGKLVSREEVDGQTVTRFHLDAPASSYLTTIGIGDYEMTEDRTKSGVPITLWVPKDSQPALKRVKFTREALEWLEGKLGPYPFDTAGALVVPATSAMETQSLPTYGWQEGFDYGTSPQVVVHELTHQWYGDLVSPSDWRDVWMNEGMTMYLQIVFEAERSKTPIEEAVEEYAFYERQARDIAGPPGAYDPRTFGEGNIYYSPALMWHELREKIGDKRFWSMVKKWPRVHELGNAGREEYFAWLEKETGEELTAFLEAWILGKETPPR